MKTSKIFRYLFMAIFTLSYSLAWGQKTIQLRLLGTTSQPNINVVYSNGTTCDKMTVKGFSGFIYGNRDMYYVNDRVFYPGAYIEVENFKYEIDRITFNGQVGSRNENKTHVRTRIVDGNGSDMWNNQVENEFGSAIGDNSSKEYPFCSGDLSQVKGLTKFYIQVTTSKGCYVRSINVTYYEPEINVNEQFPHSMQVGNIVDLKDCYELSHLGAFNTYISYSSSNTNVISVDENGIMKAVGNGTASITLTLRDRDNNGSELTHMVFNIESSKFSVDNDLLSFHCHHPEQDDPKNNNTVHDQETISVNDLKSEWIRNGSNIGTDYTFGTNISAQSGYSSLGQLKSTNSRRYRVGLQKINLFDVPPYTSYSADISFSVKVNNQGASTHGAGVLMSPNGNVTDYDNVTLKTDGSSNSNLTTNIDDYFRLSMPNGKPGTANATLKGFSIENKASSNVRDYYMAVVSYIHHTGGNDVQTSDFWYKFENEQYTYHANITYHMPDGCPFDMPTPNPWAVSSHTPDGFVTLPEIEQIADYKFAGWSTMPNGMVEYENGGEFYPYNPMTGGGRGDVHLYAVWGEVKATVKPEILNGEDIQKSVAEHRYVGLKIGSECSISGFTGECYIKDDLGHYLTSHQNENQKLYGTDNIEEAALWDVQKVIVGGNTYYRFHCLSSENQGSYLCTDVLQSELISEDDPRSLWSISPEGKMYIYVDGVYHVLDNENDRGEFWQIEKIHELADHLSNINVESYQVGDGIVSSKNVISAINTKLSAAGNQYSYMVSGSTSDADKYKGILYVDMSGLKKVVESTDSKWNSFQSSTAKNTIFFLPIDNPKYTVDHNFVWKNNSGFTANVPYILTDAEPFYSLYDYTAQSLKYQRSFSAKWGTIFLPFQLKNNNSNIKYYNLDASNDMQMAFAPYNNDISAYTSIVCCANSSIDVNYSNIAVRKTDKGNLAHSVTVGKYDMESATKNPSETTDWQVCGTIFDRKIFGQSETAYYFSNNQLRYVNPNGSVKMLPLRGYFKPGGNSGIKPFSFVVLDEEGATDITNIVNGNDDVSDGKIYDLSGRRVKSPIKGHIYIVNGNKKMY